MAFVGNVMIDTLLAARTRAMESRVLEELGVADRSYCLVTLHRPSNVDDPGALARLLDAIDAVAREHDLRVVFPTHPRTRQQLTAAGLDPDSTRWLLRDPVGYIDFLRLQASARIVLTDSGGVQEETTVLGVPCVTLRENTERPCTIAEGTNTLAGTGHESILQAARLALLTKTGGRVPRFWDGRSAERIAEHLAPLFE